MSSYFAKKLDICVWTFALDDFVNPVQGSDGAGRGGLVWTGRDAEWVALVCLQAGSSCAGSTSPSSVRPIGHSPTASCGGAAARRNLLLQSVHPVPLGTRREGIQRRSRLDVLNPLLAAHESREPVHE